MDKAKYVAAMKLLENPDTAPEGLVLLNDLVNVDSEAYTTYQKTLADTQTTINTLRDTNSKLALRITSPVETQAPVDDKPKSFADLYQAAVKAQEGSEAK